MKRLLSPLMSLFAILVLLLIFTFLSPTTSQTSPAPTSCTFVGRDLRRIRPMLYFKTASTIATPIVHSKLDYCNSLFLNLDSTQIQRHQLIQNSLARVVTRTPMQASSYTTPGTALLK